MFGAQDTVGINSGTHDTTEILIGSKKYCDLLVDDIDGDMKKAPTWFQWQTDGLGRNVGTCAVLLIEVVYRAQTFPCRFHHCCLLVPHAAAYKGIREVEDRRFNNKGVPAWRDGKEI